MSSEKIPFSKWLAKKFNVSVQDMSKTKFPRLWLKFTGAHAIAVKKKYVYVRDLAGLPEDKLWVLLVHEICRHICRQRRITWTLFLVRYALSQRFRRDEEINAFSYTMEAYYIQGKNISTLPGQIAAVLDDVYLLSDKHAKHAEKKLTERVAKIKSGEFSEVRKLRDQWRRETI